MPIDIDKEVLLKKFDNDPAFLKEVLDLFEDSSKQCIDKIEEAIAENDADKLRKAAHSIKGAGSNFSPSFAASYSNQIEQLAKNGELKNIPALFENLKKEVKELIDSVSSALEN